MRIKASESCPICKENRLRSFICTDCYLSFCRDCLIQEVHEDLICSNCGNERGFISKKGVVECSSCRSTNVHRIEKTQGKCPRCQTTSVMKIPAFRDYLLQWFQNILVQAKDFFKPISATYEYLKVSRNRLQSLRTDIPKAYHYPEMDGECNLWIHLFMENKREARDLVHDFFLDLSRNFPKIIQIPTCSIVDLPYTREVLNRFEIQVVKTRNAIEKLFENVTQDTKPMLEKIALLEEQQALFRQNFEKYQLQQNEKFVYGFHGKLLEFRRKEQEDGGKTKGLFLLTNRRLLFLQEQGFLKKSLDYLFELPLETFNTINISGRVFKALEANFSEIQLKLNPISEEFAEIEYWFNYAKRFEEHTENPLEENQPEALEIEAFKKDLDNAIFELISYTSSKEHLKSQEKLFENHIPIYFAKSEQQKEHNEEQTPPVSKYEAWKKEAKRWQINPGNNQGTNLNQYDQAPAPYTYHEERTRPYTRTNPNSSYPSEHSGYEQGYYTQEHSPYPHTNQDSYSPEHPPYPQHEYEQQFPYPPSSTEYGRTQGQERDSRNSYHQSNQYGEKEVHPTSRRYPQRDHQRPPSDAPQLNRNRNGHRIQRADPRKALQSSWGETFETPSKKMPLRSALLQKTPELEEMDHDPYGLHPHSSRFVPNTVSRREQNGYHESELKSRLLEWQQEEYGLQRSLELLQEEMNAGNLSQVDFFRHFKQIQKELYIVRQHISEIQAHI